MPLVAARTVWVLISMALLVAAGVVWTTYRELDTGVERSYAISADDPKSAGAANILVMGLTTRLDLHGQPLPDDLLRQMQAGESDRGGYNANTLIVLHVPGDGSPATAMSVPRDNYVDFVGVPEGPQQGKIKEVYGRAKEVEERKLREAGVHDPRTLERGGREAGRRAQVRTVSAFLNVPIDHLAEVSLVGFFHIAEGLGGVDVCLNKATKDTMSGADFPAGRQHLTPQQSLAFVRQRHGLANGDLDRTRRQQAFLAAVTQRLKGADVGAISALVDVAQQDVVLDHGLNLLELARKPPSGVRFHTLPIESGGMVEGQSVNLVDKARLQQIVANLINPPPAGTAAPPPAMVSQIEPQATNGGAAAVPTGPPCVD